MLPAAAVFILLLAASSSERATAQNAQPRDDNFYFYPEHKQNIRKCNVPPFQNTTFTPQPGMCENVSEVLLSVHEESKADVQRLAEAYAPYLYFHPLEQFTMSAVNRTFRNASQGEIRINFDGSLLVDDELNQTTLMRSTRDRDFVLRSHNFYFQHLAIWNDYEYKFVDAPTIQHLAEDPAQTEQLPIEDAPDTVRELVDNAYKRGDGFSDDGKSNAPIYYNVFDSGNGTITFNYYFYYTWNGPSSFGVITSHNATEQYISMIMSPWGVHEGDWESMSVTVCKTETPSQPLAVTYRQSSGFGQRYDCTKGECIFQRDTGTHPVGFVALHTHDVYAMSVRELVYDEAWPLEFWVNLQGFLAIHRTAYASIDGSFRYYEPNGTNVIRLAEQDEIPDRVDESEYWGAFGGNWGRPTANESALIESDQPFCLDNSTVNSTVPCPDEVENPIFFIVMQLLGVNQSTGPVIEAASLLVDYLVGNHMGTSPLGPAAQPHYKHLGSVASAPIYSRVLDPNVTGPEYCLRLTEIPDTFRLPPEENILPLTKAVFGIITLCACFTFGTFIYIVSWTYLVPLRPTMEFDENGVLQPPNKRLGRFWVYHMAALYTCAYAVCWVGTGFFYVGYDRLLKLLEEFFNTDYSQLLNLLLVIGVLVVLIDTLYLIALWIRSDDIWRTINRTYFDIIGDDEGVKRFDKLRVFGLNVHKSVSVLSGFMLLSLILAVLMAVFGVMFVGLAFAIGEVCREFIGSLEGICFRFPGMLEIKCGEDFHKFCNAWAEDEMLMTMWGAFVVVMGHFFLIASAGVSKVQLQGSRRVLILLPTREQYAEMLKQAEASKGEQPESVDPDTQQKQAWVDDSAAEQNALSSTVQQASEEVDDLADPLFETVEQASEER